METTAMQIGSALFERIGIFSDEMLNQLLF
jgi:hypothetical protein